MSAVCRSLSCNWIKVSDKRKNVENIYISMFTCQVLEQVISSRYVNMNSCKLGITN
jgi:hypothetical protein